MNKRPGLCINCGKLRGVESVCPYCGADNARVGLKLKGWLSKGKNGESASRLTVFLIGANAFLFALAAAQGLAPSAGGFEVLSPSSEVLFVLGIQHNPAVEAGQWWRLVMAVFLHLGVIHLVFNCVVLWTMGRVVEEEFGARIMFTLYMWAGVAGFVASYFADIGGAGASGAVSGLLGAVIARRWLVDGNLSHPASRYAVTLILLTVVMSLVVGNINHVAHGVGFVVGALLSGILTKVRLGKKGAIGFALVTVATALGTTAAFGLMLLSLTHGSPQDFSRVQNCWLYELQPVANAYTPAMPLERLERCLEEMPGLEDPADEARAEARAAVRTLRAARVNADGGLEEQGLTQLKDAARRYVLWRETAAPRYGYGMKRR
jgi:rhomboid protease GluP